MDTTLLKDKDLILTKLKDSMRASRGIPALEGTANEVLKKINSGGGSHIDELAALITGDFALTQRILKLVNSPMYAPFSKGTKSVSEALRILGSRAVVHLILSALIIDESDVQEDEEMVKAMMASELTQCLGGREGSEDATIASLLYNVGKLVTARFLPKENMRIERLVDMGYSADSAELAVLHLPIKELGAEVARWWHLPNDIVSIINGTGDKSLIAIAQFATTAVSLMRAGLTEEVGALLAKQDFSDESRNKLIKFVEDKARQAMNEPRRIRAPAVPDAPEFNELGVEEGLAVLSEYIRAKDVTDRLVIPAFVNGLREVVKASHCLILAPDKTGAYVVTQGSGDDLSKIGESLILTHRGRTTVAQALLVNSVDVMVLDLAKFNTRSLPDKFMELFPDAKMLSMLPVLTKDKFIGCVLFLVWSVPYALGALDVARLKKLRVSCSEHLTATDRIKNEDQKDTV